VNLGTASDERRIALADARRDRYPVGMTGPAEDPRGSRPEPPTGAQGVAALAARGLIRALGASLRLRTLGEERLTAARRVAPGGHVVFAFWHGRQFPLVYTWRRREVAILTSLSRDGTLQSLILGGLGYHIVRGSTSRGAVRGLVGMIRAVGQGRDAAFAVDGPRGPYHEVKPGVLFLARRTGLPVVPITSAAARARVFTDAWDRYLLPHPFSPTVVAYGDHLTVPPEANEEALAVLGEQLGQRLDVLTAAAEEALTNPVPEGPDRS
jgi:lysophospholipid acyltransferase (LPLAT)-like uncharacterized protein